MLCKLCSALMKALYWQHFSLKYSPMQISMERLNSVPPQTHIDMSISFNLICALIHRFVTSIKEFSLKSRYLLYILWNTIKDAKCVSQEYFSASGLTEGNSKAPSIKKSYEIEVWPSDNP